MATKAKRHTLAERLRRPDPTAAAAAMAESQGRPARRTSPATAPTTDRVRLTVYLDPEDLDLLDQEKRRERERRRSGDKTLERLDTSALIRRAVKATYGKGGK
jgi:hypothetical protein